MMKIPTIKTNSYPTRYVAFHNPGVLVESSHPKHDGGYEWTVFSERIQNKEYPHLTDGVYLEIVSYQGKALLVDGTATQPDKTRRQLRYTQLFQTYEQARSSALAWLDKAREFVAQNGDGRERSGV